MGGLGLREVALLGPLLAAVIAGTLMAIGTRGPDSAFLDVQEQPPPPLTAAEVERAVRIAPDPGTGTGRARRIRCRSRGRGNLGNPWSCTVAYTTGRRARLAVRIAEDGSYTGREAGGGRVSGCCLRLP
jgi:hypothetical protein